MNRFPWRSVHWPNSLFLIGTFLISLTAVPLYIWQHGISAFQLTLFLFMFICTGLSVTLGYHRLFSHLTFQARWPVKLFTLLFGAAAFEGSALVWAADHRRHHKHVDHEDDPYDISKGFFYAHIGWILFKLKPEPPLDNVNDLRKDPLIVWQDRYLYPIAILISFVIPGLIGWWWGGITASLGAVLIAGIARVVCVQHMTFCINSLCHTIGKRPYSEKCSARDSWLMAIFTFGEGYHNFHHEFQHDYRNGVKPWPFDPTKWTIWLLSRAALVKHLRTVPRETILLAELTEQQRLLASNLNSNLARISAASCTLLEKAQEQLDLASAHWKQQRKEYLQATEKRIEVSKENLACLKKEFHEASIRLRLAVRQWQQARNEILAQCSSF